MNRIFQRKPIFPAALLSTFFVFSSSAGLAHQKSDWLVRAGIAIIDPREESDSINFEGLELGEIGVESTNAAIVSISYFASNHLAFEVLLGKPPNFDIVGATGLIKDIPIGNIETWPLIVTAQYYPMDSQSKWQPFAGIGLNYTIPGDTKVNPELAPIFGAEKIEIEPAHSWGLVLSLGMDYLIRENITLSAEAYYIDVRAKADGKIVLDGEDFNIDIFARTGRVPVLYSVTIGYVF